MVRALTAEQLPLAASHSSKEGVAFPGRSSKIPILLDFGLATAPAPAASAAPISGAPDYIAPEQFRGTQARPAADIYAFGLLVFEMLAGVRPFPPEQLLSSVVRRTTEDAPRLSSVAPTPHAWDPLIARALSRDPEGRPGCAMELIVEMRREWAEVESRRSEIGGRCTHRARRQSTSRRGT